MQVCLIEVPYMNGDDRHGASKGPQLLTQAAADLLGARGVDISVEHVVRGKSFADSANASLVICKALAPIVQKAIVGGQLPVVLAGSCDISKGILAGFDHSRCGVVWIDAHGDFNTPETTLSGFFPGMSLAIITGHCFRNYWAQIGNSIPMSEEAILMLGVRELDPAERERLEHSAIQVVCWRQGRPETGVVAYIDKLAKRAREIYLHIDLDAFDPQVAPGIVDPPVPGGLSLEDMEAIMRAVAARFVIRAAALTTYNPDLDQDDKTLRAGLHILQWLGEYCAGQPGSV